MAKLITLLVNDIAGKFFVPNYQRGYRWTTKEVTRLLDDIYNLKGESGKPSDNYCLQPIVVKKSDENIFEVIDGQQRLTTLFLIYNYMHKNSGGFIEAPKFSLNYETRPKSSTFLENIDLTQADSNIDFYFMANAYKEIENWFISKGEKSVIMPNMKTLLAENVKIIWYEVDDTEDGAALFQRLNIGKIFLTNAELVKAMFLSRSNENIDERKQLEIALQWDNLEKELHNNSLWYFLTNTAPENYQTRIDLILDLIAGKKDNDHDEYFTFFYFDKLRQNQNLIDIWEKKIRQTFLLLKDWYEYLDFYHKIGYLISSGYKNLAEIYNESKEKTTSNFTARLDELIKESIKPETGKTYSDWTYTDDREKIQRLLFLFNVETARKSAKGTMAHWFSFNKFKYNKNKENSWSLEHIHAIKSELKSNQNIWRSWLELHREFLDEQSKENSALVEKIDKLLRLKDFSHDRFEKLQEEILKNFPEDKNIEAHINSIANLALIQCSENSALGNAAFDVKRNKIISMANNGEFVPLCTKRVFLKYYTKSEKNQIHYWSLQDMKAYIAAINDALKNYLSTPIEL